LGTQLGEALIPIRAVLDKLDGDLAQARKKTEGAMSGIAKVTSGIKNSLQTVGKAALGIAVGGLAAVGAAFLTIGKSAVNAASNLNEAINASSVVFGDAAQKIQSFAKTAAESTGLSAESVNQMGAQMGALLLNMGLDENTAAEQTINLTKRAADMASIFNTDVSDAFLAVQAGLRGETEPLRRFGVDVSDAAVKAYALSTGLIEAGDEMDNQTKITARMALIYEQTNKIAGDFVNTSDGLANSARIQAARWQNFKAELGTKLLPVVQTFQQLFMKLASTVLPKVLAALGPVFDFIQRGATAFSGFVSSLMGGAPFIDSLTVALMKLFGNDIGLKFYDIALQVQGFFQSVQELLEPVWNAFTSFVSWKDVLIGLGIAIASVIIPLIISFIATLAPIIATVVLVVAAVSLLRNAWETDWGGIQEKAAAVWAWLKVAFENIKEWLAVAIPKAIKILSDFWTTVLWPAIQAVWNWLSTIFIPFIINTVVPWLQENIPKAIQKLSDFWTTVLWPAIQAVWSFIKEKLIPIFLDVVGWLADNIPTAISTAAGFWNDTLKPALDAVWAFIKDFLWPVLLDVGTWLLTTIGTAITTAAGFWTTTLYPAIYKVWEWIYNHVLPAFLEIATWLGQTIGSVITTAAAFWNDTLKPALEAVWTVISEDLLPIFKDIGTFLKDTLGAIITGIATAFDSIVTAVKSVITWVGDAIEALGKIKDAVPDWLIPGSPTKFELGIHGIAEQFKQLSQITDSMPLFSGLGASMPALAMAGSESPQSSISGSYNTATTTIYTDRDPLKILHASRHLDRLSRIS
jgi:hypothetical protein